MSDTINEILQLAVVILPYIGIWLSFFSLKTKQRNVLKQIEIYEKWKHNMTPENKLKMENHIEELIQKTEKSNWWLAHLDACNVYILILVDVVLFVSMSVCCLYIFLLTDANVSTTLVLSFFFLLGLLLFFVFWTVVAYKSYRRCRKA